MIREFWVEPPNCGQGSKHAVRESTSGIDLRPKQIHDQLRGLEILGAMINYVEANKAIPHEWFDELQGLFGGV